MFKCLKVYINHLNIYKFFNHNFINIPESLENDHLEREIKKDLRDIMIDKSESLVNDHLEREFKKNLRNILDLKSLFKSLTQRFE